MQLLQINTNDFAILLLLTGVISIVLWYYIIKKAVKEGTIDQTKQLIIQNNLLVERLKMDGVTEERINKLLYDSSLEPNYNSPEDIEQKERQTKATNQIIAFLIIALLLGFAIWIYTNRK